MSSQFPDDESIVEALKLGGCSQIPIEVVRTLGKQNTSIYNTLYHLGCTICLLNTADSTWRDRLTTLGDNHGDDSLRSTDSSLR